MGICGSKKTVEPLLSRDSSLPFNSLVKYCFSEHYEPHIEVVKLSSRSSNSIRTCHHRPTSSPLQTKWLRELRCWQIYNDIISSLESVQKNSETRPEHDTSSLSSETRWPALSALTNLPFSDCINHISTNFTTHTTTTPPEWPCSLENTLCDISAKGTADVYVHKKQNGDILQRRTIASSKIIDYDKRVIFEGNLWRLIRAPCEVFFRLESFVDSWNLDSMVLSRSPNASKLTRLDLSGFILENGDLADSPLVIPDYLAQCITTMRRGETSIFYDQNKAFVITILEVRLGVYINDDLLFLTPEQAVLSLCPQQFGSNDLIEFSAKVYSASENNLLYDTYGKDVLIEGLQNITLMQVARLVNSDDSVTLVKLKGNWNGHEPPLVFRNLSLKAQATPPFRDFGILKVLKERRWKCEGAVYCLIDELHFRGEQFIHTLIDKSQSKTLMKNIDPAKTVWELLDDGIDTEDIHVCRVTRSRDWKQLREELKATSQSISSKLNMYLFSIVEKYGIRLLLCPFSPIDMKSQKKSSNRLKDYNIDMLKPGLNAFETEKSHFNSSPHVKKYSRIKAAHAVIFNEAFSSPFFCPINSNDPFECIAEELGLPETTLSPAENMFGLECWKINNSDNQFILFPYKPSNVKPINKSTSGSKTFVKVFRQAVFHLLETSINPPETFKLSIPALLSWLYPGSVSPNPLTNDIRKLTCVALALAVFKRLENDDCFHAQCEVSRIIDMCSHNPLELLVEMEVRFMILFDSELRVSLHDRVPKCQVEWESLGCGGCSGLCLNHILIEREVLEADRLDRISRYMKGSRRAQTYTVYFIVLQSIVVCLTKNSRNSLRHTDWINESFILDSGSNNLILLYFIYRMLNSLIDGDINETEKWAEKSLSFEWRLRGPYGLQEIDMLAMWALVFINQLKGIERLSNLYSYQLRLLRSRGSLCPLKLGYLFLYINNSDDTNHKSNVNVRVNSNGCESPSTCSNSLETLTSLSNKNSKNIHYQLHQNLKNTDGIIDWIRTVQPPVFLVRNPPPFLSDSMTPSLDFFIPERVAKYSTTLYTLGSNEKGCLGIGSPTYYPVDPSMSELDHEVPALNSAAIEAGRDLWFSATPQPVPYFADIDIVALDSGENHIVVVDSEGQLRCWGWNGNGQCGEEKELFVSIPRVLENLNVRFKYVSCGYDFSVGLTREGNLYSWGSNTWGTLGLGDFVDRRKPTIIQLDGETSSTPHNRKTGVGFSSVFCGSFSTVALGKTSEVYVWGSGQYGGLGFNDNFIGYWNARRKRKQLCYLSNTVCLPEALNVYIVPDTEFIDEHTHRKLIGIEKDTFISVPGLLKSRFKSLSNPVEFLKVALGETHTIALDSNGSLWTWGHSEFGALGLSNGDVSSLPQTIIPTHSFINISAGGNFSGAIDTMKRPWIWGSSSPPLPEPSPVNDITLNKVKGIFFASGGNRYYVVTEEGGCYFSGDGPFHCLGLPPDTSDTQLWFTDRNRRLCIRGSGWMDSSFVISRVSGGKHHTVFKTAVA